MKPSIKKLSELTGLNKSTISRALNHCGGVDAQTAAMVNRLARELGYVAPKNREESPSCCIVLPQNPDYFWSLAKERLFAVLTEERVRFRAALYPMLTDEDAFFSALDAMIALHPQLILAAVPAFPAAVDRVRKLSEEIPIFLLGERLDIANVFYFGSDRRSDGRLLGQTFQKAYPDKRRVLIIDSIQDRARTDEFLAACPALKPVGRLENDEWNNSASSLLARRIAAEYAGEFDCVYCSTGLLPLVCLAMDKLKLPPDIVCVGYENPPGNAKYIASGRIGPVLCQDIAQQSELCARAAARFVRERVFPGQKYTFIPSRMFWREDSQN